MAHYPSFSDRRLQLLSAERSYYAGHTSPQSIPAPTSQWDHLMHRSSNYPADSAPIASSFSNCWNALAANDSGWPTHSSTQSSYRSSSSNLSSEISTPSEFPESSQRTILPPPHALPAALFALDSYRNDMRGSPSPSPDYDDHSWGDDLFNLEDQEASPQVSLSAPPLPAVKVETDDANDCFIMELSAPQSTSLSQSLAPPTEVPLRATQASKEMRKMMGVFRLNPFTMHSGAGRGAVSPSWYGGEARPLDEEPVTLEFQLELDDPLASPKEPLRSFSPDFELEADRDDAEQNEWNEYDSQSSSFPGPMTPAWELEYSPGDELLSSSESSSAVFSSRRSSRLHNLSHPYLRKTTYSEPQEYTTCATSNSAVDLNRSRLRRLPSEPSWPHIAYAQSSRSTTYAADSPDCDLEGLPAIAATNRRWSLPDPSVHQPFFI